MADLIPPVPNEDFQRPYPWWDWFRKIRKNINEFAASIVVIVNDIAAIVTQITNVSDASQDTFAPASFSAVTNYNAAATTAATIVTSGYPVLAMGNIGANFVFSSGTVPYSVNVIAYIYRDGSIQASSGVSSWHRTSNFTSSTYLTTTLPIMLYDPAPSSASHSYDIRLSATFYDSTGATVASTGDVTIVSYFYVKEVKT
jgi:hypothetical protein